MAAQRLRLYVTSLGDESATLRRRVLDTLGAAGLDCEVEVVALLEQPGRAVRDGVLATPTLAHVDHPDRARVIGSFTDPAPLLGLARAEAVE